VTSILVENITYL